MLHQYSPVCQLRSGLVGTNRMLKGVTWQQDAARVPA